MGKTYIAHAEQERADRPGDPVRREQPVPHVRASTSLWRSRRWADGVRDLRFLRSCAVCRPTVPDRHGGGTHGAVPRNRGPPRGRYESTGKLHGELCPNGVMSRDAFEEVLGAMARAGLVRLSDAVFEKDGKQIPYRRVSLARGWRGRRTDSHRVHHKRFCAGLGNGQEQEEGRYAREAKACGTTGKGSPAKAGVIGPTRRIGFPYRSGPA